MPLFDHGDTTVSESSKQQCFSEGELAERPLL